MRSLLLCLTFSLLAGCTARQQPSSGYPFPLIVTTARHPVTLNYDRCERDEHGRTQAVFEVENVSDLPVLCHWSSSYSFATLTGGEWRATGPDHWCLSAIVEYRFELMPGEKTCFPTFLDPTAEAVTVGIWFTTSEQDVESAWVWSEPVSVACVVPAEE
jgi:hypothetical protein